MRDVIAKLPYILTLGGWAGILVLHIQGCAKSRKRYLTKDQHREVRRRVYTTALAGLAALLAIGVIANTAGLLPAAILGLPLDIAWAASYVAISRPTLYKVGVYPLDKSDGEG